MGQLLARIDDELHQRLKDRAAAEGRSLNALVTEILRRAVGDATPVELLRARLRAGDRLVEPPVPETIPTRDEVAEASRGAGTSVSEALAAERDAR